MKTNKLLLTASLLLLTGCASIVSGTTQTINVSTTPAGARCELVREGKVFATIASTPGSVEVDRLKHDITINCSAPGYQTSTYINESGAAGATFGNIILGGGIGWAVDSARGADNSYDENVHINLTKL